MTPLMTSLRRTFPPRTSHPVAVRIGLTRCPRSLNLTFGTAAFHGSRFASASPSDFTDCSENNPAPPRFPVCHRNNLARSVRGVFLIYLQRSGALLFGRVGWSLSILLISTASLPLFAFLVRLRHATSPAHYPRFLQYLSPIGSFFLESSFITNRSPAGISSLLF